MNWIAVTFRSLLLMVVGMYRCTTVLCCSSPYSYSNFTVVSELAYLGTLLHMEPPFNFQFRGWSVFHCNLASVYGTEEGGARTHTGELQILNIITYSQWITWQGFCSSWTIPFSSSSSFVYVSVKEKLQSLQTRATTWKLPGNSLHKHIFKNEVQTIVLEGKGLFNSYTLTQSWHTSGSEQMIL